jgi:hypothetical protein
MLVSLTEEQQVRLRNGVMRTMSEEQRQQASATKMDRLIQFIYQKAKQDIMNRKAMGQIDSKQQQQQEHGIDMPNSLIVSPRGVNATTSQSTTVAPNTQNYLIAGAAIDLAQAALAANIPLASDQHCANCGGLAKQRLTGRINERDNESLPFNYCSKNCQREYWASVGCGGGQKGEGKGT